MGHYLSACAMMAAATGDGQLKARAERIVAALAECQSALGDSGYLSAFPETWIDRVETLQRVWAPYYTLHKIYAGLMDVHRFLGNEQALEIAEKMAKWNAGRLARLSEEQMQQILNRTEQGGMNEAFANLAALTGNDAYLQLARRFNQKTYTEPLLNRQDQLKGLLGPGRQPSVLLHRRHQRRRALAQRPRRAGPSPQRPHAGNLLHVQHAQAHPAPVYVGPGRAVRRLL